MAELTGSDLGRHEVLDGQKVTFEIVGDAKVTVKIAETQDGRRALIFEILGKKQDVPFSRPDGTVYDHTDDGGAHFSVANVSYSDRSPEVVIRPQPEAGSYQVHVSELGQRIVLDS